MARQVLTSGSSTAERTNYETDTVTVNPGSAVVLFVSHAVPLLPTTPTAPTASLGGQPLQQVRTVTNGDRRLTCLVVFSAASTTAPVTIDFGGQVQDYCAWSVLAYDNVRPDATIAAAVPSTGNGTSLTVSMPVSADPARNPTVAALILNSAKQITAGPRMTEVHEVPVDQVLGKDAVLQTQGSDTAQGAISWTWTGNAEAAAIGVELTTVVPAGGGGSGGSGEQPGHPDDPLIRRFEPILFLHPDETLVPVNAKRFVENAALWRAGSPADATENWGGNPGDPFPRSPKVPAGDLSGLASEGGTFLGDAIEGVTDELFLELGGWTDTDGAAEAGVTDTSVNRRANRDAIEDRFRNDLSVSRFWYHAEVIRSPQLSRLAGRTVTPPLRQVLAGLKLRDPLLLCYYFFFPAHEQTVETNDAEVASHAGDWQSMCVLLDGDGTGALATYAPKYLGLTGSRPAPGPAGYPPYQFDGERRAVMTVAEWAAGSPETTAEHPRLFVARGSHSLYTTPGEHAVDPYPGDIAPQSGGAYDWPGLAPAPPESDEGSPGSWLKGIGAFLAKIVAAAAAGTMAGPAGGAVTYAGMLSGVFEWIDAVSPPFGIDREDRPKPDSAPATPGEGVTIRPKGVQLGGITGDVFDWQAAQGVRDGGRVYDYVVDRESQVWWPNHDGERGFRGRWGQRVTQDPLPRRSGPLFPDCVDMFLRALADGFDRQLLRLPG